MATATLASSVMRKVLATPNLRVSAPCSATIGHTPSARTMKKSGYACGPALFRKIDCAALNAVYMAQPTTIAKPATCRVRPSSVRRTWRSFARRGDMASDRAWLGLLDACDLLQSRDPLLDRRVGVEQAREKAAVVLFGVVDHHGRDRVVEARGRRVVMGDLLQRRDQPGRVASELDTAHVGERLTLPGQGQLHERADDERDEREYDADGEHDQRPLPAKPRAADGVPEPARDEDGQTDHRRHDEEQAHVEVLDVAHLVGKDTFELLLVHHLEQPHRDSDRGVVGIAPSRERVRTRIVDHVDL